MSQASCRKFVILLIAALIVLGFGLWADDQYSQANSANRAQEATTTQYIVDNRVSLQTSILQPFEKIGGGYRPVVHLDGYSFPYSVWLVVRKDGPERFTQGVPSGGSIVVQSLIPAGSSTFPISGADVSFLIPGGPNPGLYTIFIYKNAGTSEFNPEIDLPIFNISGTGTPTQLVPVARKLFLDYPENFQSSSL